MGGGWRQSKGLGEGGIGDPVCSWQREEAPVLQHLEQGSSRQEY